MIQSKLGFKVLGLCALVLGLMAIGTGAAQAEVGSHWNVAGKAISSTLLPQVQIKELEGKDGKLLTKIAGVVVEILCTSATLEEAVLKTEGGSLGRVRFAGCIMKLNGVTSPPCEPHKGAEKGVILTELVKDLIVLHKLEGGALDTLDRFEPDAGETFVTVALSEECAIGESLPIKGKFFAKDCQNEFGVEKTTHLIEQGPLTHLFVISDTPEHAATIDGSLILELTGAHAGLKWSGTPI